MTYALCTNYGRHTVKLRLAAAAVAGLALALGVTGCNMMTPQATTNEYNPGDGLNGQSGEVAFRNALLVVDGDSATNASLNVTFFNESDSPQSVSLQVGQQQISVTLQPGVTVYGSQENQIVVPVDSPVAGSLVNATVTAEGGDAVGTQLQVFSTDNAGYEDRGPTSAPEADGESD